MSSSRWMLVVAWLAFIPLIQFASGGGTAVKILTVLLGFGLMGYGLLAVLSRWREYRSRADYNERRFAAEMIALRQRSRNDQP